MIFKRKKKYFPFLNLFKTLFKKIIFIFGVTSFLTFIFFTTYYFTSGMYQRFKPLILVKKIDENIFDKYLGFSFFKIDDYARIKLISLKYIFFKNQLEIINIKINQENLYNLELQRKKKIDFNTENFKTFSNAELNYLNSDYKIKIRVKGDRVLHWYNKNETSYKIDLKGDDRLWGMEEFSVQKPITRNYIYEYIFHKFLKYNDLISLKYFFINLSLNNSKQGIYAVEEGFSKQLIENNKRRNGPIFGLEENRSYVYPEVEYDLYSKNYWYENNQELTKIALSKLNRLKNDEIKIDEIFDINKWATYFAIIDLTSTFHGSIPKSVKLYYNPTTAKFEPIGYDGHYNSNLFNNFLILDFLDPENKECDYICGERNWFLKFLANQTFLDTYLNKLNEISAKDFINKFYKSNIEMIDFYNKQFLSEKSNSDKVLYKGIGFYQFNKDYLNIRSEYIQKRIKKFKKKSTNKDNHNNHNIKNILLEKNITLKNGEYNLKGKLDINDNYYLPKGATLNVQEGTKIFFNKDFTILSEGSIIFDGKKENPIIIFSDENIGSLVFMNNYYKFRHVVIKNLSYPKNKSKILYGGINIINSDLEIYDTKIINSNSEDAINIISSNSTIKNLEMNNIKSDAIDIDFGTLKFENIICKNINNDCLDVSGANIVGNLLNGTNIKDKGLSFGEESVGKITKIYFENTKLGIAVKDGSELNLEEYKLINNEYDIAVFNKKKEYKGASLYLNKQSNTNKLNFLIGHNNELIENNIPITTKIDNEYIYNLFY